MTESYTVKELLQEVRTDNKAALNKQAEILVRLSNIDDHLTKLNSKVAIHERKLYSLKTFQSKVMTVWAIIVVVFTTVANRVIAIIL